jgi:hypothetical protein
MSWVFCAGDWGWDGELEVEVDLTLMAARAQAGRGLRFGAREGIRKNCMYWERVSRSLLATGSSSWQ